MNGLGMNLLNEFKSKSSPWNENTLTHNLRKILEAAVSKEGRADSLLTPITIHFIERSATVMCASYFTSLAKIYLINLVLYIYIYIYIYIHTYIIRENNIYNTFTFDYSAL